VVSNDLDMTSIWRGWLVLLPKKKVKLGCKISEKQLPKRLRLRRVEQKELLLLLQKKCPDLFEGRSGAKLSTQERNELVDLIHSESPSETKFKQRMHFLILGIMMGNDTGLWEINPPAPPLLHKKHTSLITLNAASSRHKINELKAWFMASLECMDDLDKDERRGQLLFAMIVFGGVFNAKKLVLLCNAINKGQVRSSKGHFWAMLQDETEKENDSLQMWFADPLSEALFYKWVEYSENQEEQKRLIESGPLSSRAIWKFLKVFLDAIAPHEYTLPSSLGSFLDLARSGVIFDLTPFLIGYASGNKVCESLPPQAWLRLRENCKLSNKFEDDPVEIQPRNCSQSLPRIGATSKAAKDQDSFKQKLSEFVMPSEKSTLYGVSRRERAEALQEWMEKNISDMRPITALIASWALYMLRQTETKKQAVGGIATYISKISRLYDVSGDLYLPELEADELMPIYEQFVMRLKGLKSRGQNCACLRYFHEFMIQQYAASEVDFSLIDGFSNPEGRVDANIVTSQEFELLKDHLMLSMEREKDSAKYRIYLIQLLVVILGYRCGLRASEARKIRIMDVLLSPTKPELLIRNNAFSRLKTSNGVRQIPLHCFLQDDELNILKQWHRKRSAEVLKKKDRPLFTRLADDKFAISSSLVFPYINDLMRIMTGDNSIHFHHLRHSFASWTLLRLIAPDYPQMLESDIARNNGITECRDLAVALTGQEHSGSKAMYALARLMGHASPAETMHSYLHLFDWMLGKALLRVTPPLTPEIARTVFGTSNATISRRLKQHPGKTQVDATMLIESRRKQFKDQFKDETQSMARAYCRTQSKQVDKIISEVTMHRHSPLNMWMFMHWHDQLGISMDDISYDHHIDVDQLNAWWSAAERVASSRTRTQRKCKSKWEGYSRNRSSKIKTIRPMVNGKATRLHQVPHLESLTDRDEDQVPNLL